MALLCPHGDSNPSLGLERAPSWAPRRWGRLEACEIVPHASLAFSKACGIVSSHKSIVNEKGVNFTRSMYADGVDTFDIAGCGWTRDEDCGFGVARQMDCILK